MVEDDEKILCDRCGGLITPEDILTGLAIKLETELICPACIDMLPARTKVQINRLRAMHGLDVTTYRVVDPELPGNNLYTFTNTSALIQHRRTLKTEGSFDAPLLTDAAAGHHGAPPPPPVPPPFSRLPGRTRYALIAIGVTLGALLALLLLPTGNPTDRDGDTDPAGDGTAASPDQQDQQVLLAEYAALDELEAWRRARRDDRLTAISHTNINRRLIARKRAELDLARRALAETHYSRCLELLDRTPLPADVAFQDLKEEDRELREAVTTALEPPPDENEPPPDENEPPPDENKPPPDENEPPPDENEPPPDEDEPPPDENEPPPDPATLIRFVSAGKEVWLERMSAWAKERDGIRSQSMAASFSRRLHLPAGDWRLWIQGFCPDKEAPAITAACDGTPLTTTKAITKARSTWLPFAPEIAVTVPDGVKRAAVRLTVHTTGQDWFIKRIALVDARIPTDTQLDLDGRRFLDWVRPQPEPVPPGERPATVIGLAELGHRTGSSLHRFDDRNLVGPQKEILTSLPSNVAKRILKSGLETLRIDDETLRPQVLAGNLPAAIDVSGGGLVALVYPNRREAGALGVILEDHRRRRWQPTEPWSFTAEKGKTWQAMTIDASTIPVPEAERPDFDPRQLSRIILYDTDPGTTYPFYLAKLTARTGAPAAPADLQLLPRALRNVTTGQLKRLILQVGTINRWSRRHIFTTFDPRQVSFLVGGNLNPGWRTDFRKRLAPLFGVRESGDLPRGLIRTMVWQNQWLDETFIREHLRQQEHHIVVVMTAGTELQIGLTKKQALINFWDKMAAEAQRSGFLPVVVLGPSKVDPHLEATADELWDELAEHIRSKHRYLPIIDLRPVEALDSLRFARDAKQLSLDLLHHGYEELVDRIEIVKLMMER